MKNLIFVGSILLASAGFAQAPSNSTEKDDDPNGTICRIITETGSRLNRSRICKTRAEWAEWRRELRENSERTQLRRINPAND